MAGAWELQESVLCSILHTDVTTIAWAFGLRNLILPGDFLPIAGMPYDHARNVGCQAVLERPIDWIFYLDSDVVPPRDAVLRLMAHRQPIISGVYARRSPPVSLPVMMRNGTWITDYTPGEVIEADVVGAGCLLIHRSVLEKFRENPLGRERGKPWFDWRVDMGGLLPPGEAMSEDFTFCFPKGTWVMGKRMKPIEQVKVGDCVINHRGAVAKVLDCSSRMYSGEMVRVVSHYMRGIEATPGHRFYVRTKRKTGTTISYLYKSPVWSPHYGYQKPVTMEVGTKRTMWVEAKDIQQGDWLYVPKIKIRKGDGIRSFAVSHFISRRSLSEFPDGTIGYKRTRKDALRINTTVRVTPDLCRLLGYFLAEGFCPDKKHTVQFAFGSTEHDYISDCRALLESQFGAKSSLYVRGGGSVVVCSSKILGRLFAALCGTGAYNKHLPRFWSRLSRDCLVEMLKGYWRGDGTVSRKVFSMGTMSEQLAREVQAALLRVNILSGVRTTENQHGTVYTVSVPSALASRFAEIVDYQDYDRSPDKKQDRYFRETKTHFLVQVRKVEKRLWEGEVYNLKVAGRESYTANGVAVHNCLHARRAFGYKILVDTSVVCKHVGYCQSLPGRFESLEVATHT